LNEHRQKTITINSKKYKIDAYDPKSNTIYEFLGDFWYGNPDKFDLNDINAVNKTFFKKLCQNTVDRIILLKQNNYNVIYIWESKWNNIKDKETCK
jgi:hypothetical protein